MSNPDRDDGEKVTEKAQPDDPSCLTIPVDLGEDITDDITDGEYDNGGRQSKQTDQFDSGDVGRDQARNKSGHDNQEPGGNLLVHNRFIGFYPGMIHSFFIPFFVNGTLPTNRMPNIGRKGDRPYRPTKFRGFMIACLRFDHLTFEL